MRNLLAAVIPILVTIASVLLFMLGIVVFAYLVFFAIIFWAIIIVISWLKARFWPERVTRHQIAKTTHGRTIDQ